KRPWHMLTLSAPSEQGLGAMVKQYNDYVVSLSAAPMANHSNTALADLCYTANTGRSHFAHRLSFAAQSLSQLQAQLSAFTAHKLDAGVSQGYVPDHQAAPRVGYLFTGQGAQYVGMGRTLYETQPLFRAALDECEALFQAATGTSLLAV